MNERPVAQLNTLSHTLNSSNTSNTSKTSSNTSNTSNTPQHTCERATSERDETEHVTFGLNASTSNTSRVDIFHTRPADSNNEDQSDTSKVRKRGFATSPRDFKSNKRQRPSNSTGEDNSQHDNQAKETSVHSTRSPSIQALRFACPYFKHDPKEFGKRSACSGPGWESVHRVK